MNYLLWKRFIVLINGRAKIRIGQYNNGNPCQIYLAKCKWHGYFEDSLHGYAEYMTCSKCSLEYDLNFVG